MRNVFRRLRSFLPEFTHCSSYHSSVVKVPRRRRRCSCLFLRHTKPMTVFVTVIGSSDRQTLLRQPCCTRFWSLTLSVSGLLRFALRRNLSRRSVISGSQRSIFSSRRIIRLFPILSRGCFNQFQNSLENLFSRNLFRNSYRLRLSLGPVV